MLRNFLKPEQESWHETFFGYEFTWVDKNSPYKEIPDYYRPGESLVSRISCDDSDRITAAINELRGDTDYIGDSLIARTKEEYASAKIDARVVHYDTDCLEVSTPACQDWRWHIEFYRECNKVARKHGLTPYRMRGVEQTQDMHVNVSFADMGSGKAESVRMALNMLYIRYPVLSWLFAAAYNNETAQIPYDQHTWDSIRTKANYSSRIEFRPPCMPKTELEIRAVGEFHRKLFTFAYLVTDDEFDALHCDMRIQYSEHRLRKITFRQCVEDFAFLCNLLDVDMRLFERMMYDNLLRRLTHYPECRI